MKRSTALLLCLVIAFSLFSCTDNRETVQNDDSNIHIDKKAVSTDLMKDIKVDSPQTKPLPVDYDPITSLAVSLFSECYESEKNILISPLSVICALGMVQNGAEGGTLYQMEGILSDRDSLNSYLYNYKSILHADEDTKFHIANSIWIRDTDNLTVHDEFLETNAAYYSSSAYKSAFDKATADEINLWVNENTDGMINNIIDDIPEDAIMYLINALCFDAKWETPYEDYNVREGDFTPENKKIKKAEFMYSDLYSYLSDENTTGFIKNYKGGDYAFVALLPKEEMTIEEYHENFSAEKLSALLEGKERTMVRTSLPKFEMEYDKDLSDILIEMGMGEAFSKGDADFSSLGDLRNKDENIYISQVIHKTYISVTEQGTRAGAVTSVQMDATGCIPADPKTVYLDRPFIYLIIDTKTNTPIFMGALMEP